MAAKATAQQPRTTHPAQPVTDPQGSPPRLGHSATPRRRRPEAAHHQPGRVGDGPMRKDAVMSSSASKGRDGADGVARTYRLPDGTEVTEFTGGEGGKGGVDGGAGGRGGKGAGWTAGEQPPTRWTRQERILVAAVVALMGAMFLAVVLWG